MNRSGLDLGEILMGFEMDGRRPVVGGSMPHYAVFFQSHFAVSSLPLAPALRTV